MTGAGLVGAGFGVQMFTFRQFSLPTVPVLPGGFTCGQIGGVAVASSVAGAHFAAGCGGFHRRLRTGGAANGMPRNAHERPRSTPWTAPFEVLAKHDPACVAVLREAKTMTLNTVTIARPAVEKRMFIAASCRGGTMTGVRGIGNGQQHACATCALTPAVAATGSRA